MFFAADNFLKIEVLWLQYYILQRHAVSTQQLLDYIHYNNVMLNAGNDATVYTLFTSEQNNKNIVT